MPPGLSNAVTGWLLFEVTTPHAAAFTRRNTTLVATASKGNLQSRAG